MTRRFANSTPIITPEALKQLDAIDARQPDLAESQNLRGVIFMRQGIYDKAEAALA